MSEPCVHGNVEIMCDRCEIDTLRAEVERLEQQLQKVHELGDAMMYDLANITERNNAAFKYRRYREGKSDES